MLREIKEFALDVNTVFVFELSNYFHSFESQSCDNRELNHGQFLSHGRKSKVSTFLFKDSGLSQIFQLIISTSEKMPTIIL